MLALTGAADPTSLDDLLERMTLRPSSLRLGTGTSNFRSRLDEVFGPERLPTIFDRCPSPGAQAVIAKFACIEADITNPGLKGVGRMIPAAFPRLGGILYGDARQEAAAVLRAAVERTLHAGYLLALTLDLNLERPISITNPDTLWERLVPLAFESSSDLHDYVYALADVWDFWERILVGLGMAKRARGLKRPSKIMSNISGLAIPGTMLAYIERGDGGPTR